RWKIQSDAIGMALATPLPGSGLGNFRSVFALFHHAMGAADYDIVHPESDWLWLLDEMGWIAPILAFAAAFLLFKRALPLGADRENQHLRAAACACGIMFILHGFIDVACHRFGSACVPICAFSFSVNPQEMLRHNR